jgi:hypothetical protein
MIPFNPTEP